MTGKVDGLGSIFSGVANAFSTLGSYNQAKSDSRAYAQTGYTKARLRAQDLRSLVSAQKNAFVRAGVEFEGTPQAVMQDTYNTGIQDITEMQSSYNKQINNMMKQARAQLLGSLLNSGLSIFSGSYNLFGGGK